MIMFENRHINIPHFLLPKSVHNKGNFIISLSDLCRWLGEHAESLGVEILPGVAGSKVLYNEDGSVEGV